MTILRRMSIKRLGLFALLSISAEQPAFPANTSTELTQKRSSSFYVQKKSPATKLAQNVAASGQSFAKQSTAQTTEGDNALNVGDYSRAEKYFSSTLQNLSKGSTQEGYLRTGYGEALLWLDRVPEAAAQFKKARGLISGKGVTVDVKQQVRLSDDLAWLAQAQNKTDLSIQYATESVQQAKSDTNVPPLMLVSSLIHLAYLQNSNEQLEKAAASYKEALSVQTAAAGPQSLLGADIKGELGGVLRRLGHVQESDQQFQEALQIKFAANAPTSPFEPHPYWNDVIFRFQLGKPNCLRKHEGNQELQIITANGVTVAASMSSDSTDLVKSGRIDLAIKNDSTANVQVLPQPAVFYTLLPKVMLARQLNPAELASKVEKKGEKKAKWVRFMGANATQTETTTMIGNGGFYGFPPMYSYGGNYPIVNRSGNMTTMMTQVPDYPAQERALAKAASIAGQARDTAAQIRNDAIGATTISAGQSVSGALFFDVSKVQKASLQIPIGNALFEFTFPPI